MNGRRRGFTLIEVFLAITILSIGLVVLLTASSRCLAVMKVARNCQAVQWTMTLGELDHPIVATNDVKSLAVDPYTYPNGLSFSRVVEDDDDKDGLYVVRTRVSWADRSRDMFEEVTRYVLESPKQ